VDEIFLMLVQFRRRHDSESEFAVPEHACRFKFRISEHRPLGHEYPLIVQRAAAVRVHTRTRGRQYIRQPLRGKQETRLTRHKHGHIVAVLAYIADVQPAQQLPDCRYCGGKTVNG
jgi:hypothetical protein